MKMIKRLVAGMAAAVMAFSTLSIGANATTDTWAVRYSPGAPSYFNIFSADRNLSVSGTKTQFHDECTSFIQTSYYGVSSSVTVEAYKISNNQHSTLYISTFTSTFNDDYPLAYSVSSSTNFHINHTLNNNPYGCSMSGTCWI